MEELIVQFRSALDKIDWKTMPAGFKNFPRGTCGDISDILAEHLRHKGIQNIEYVCGEKEGKSHAWLEINGIAVDVTADQFPDITNKILIQHPSVWHSKYEEVKRRKAGYLHMNGPAIAGIIKVHNEVNKQLNA